jgi:hypothetical protein
MPRYRIAPALALLFALFAEPAWAFLDPPYITPANPTADERLSVMIGAALRAFRVRVRRLR